MASTSELLRAPNKTNEPSPKVLIKVNKPPKDIFLFLYNEDTTIVALHPGIAPNKDPIIGCVHLGNMSSFSIVSFFSH